ncbi:MAG: fibronectin type III domain-containing protein, partial [Dehalococcoidia bacterium]|nr:fibronectin type III domain-containing protein [Dehalococcoidia bacterium]
MLTFYRIAPASTGGSAITVYKVTANPGGKSVTVDSSTVTATFTDLTNGAYYSFTVVATNSVGDGATSTPSSLVQPATVPGAPTNVYAIAGDAQATVTWSAPEYTGGATTTAYKV